jgi:hypothetical protein
MIILRFLLIGFLVFLFSPAPGGAQLDLLRKGGSPAQETAAASAKPSGKEAQGQEFPSPAPDR